MPTETEIGRISSSSAWSETRGERAVWAWASRKPPFSKLVIASSVMKRLVEFCIGS